MFQLNSRAPSEVRTPPAADSAVASPVRMQAQTGTPAAPAHPAKTPHAKRSAEDFIFGKVIGDGCFSTVYLAKDIHTGKEYASEYC